MAPGEEKSPGGLKKRKRELSTTAKGGGGPKSKGATKPRVKGSEKPLKRASEKSIKPGHGGSSAAAAADVGAEKKKTKEPKTPRERRLAAKEMSESRKRKRKPNYDLERDLALLWEKMRCYNITKEERSRFVTQALQKMNGKFLEIAGSHVSARVLQPPKSNWNGSSPLCMAMLLLFFDMRWDLQWLNMCSIWQMVLRNKAC